MTETKRDHSISMAQANVIVMFISIPEVILQYVVFLLLRDTTALKPTRHPAFLILAVLLGIVIHEGLHGLGWVIFGGKPFSSVKFGFQWKTLTLYTDLTEPVEVNAYWLEAFMPGFLLRIFPYILSLGLGNGDLSWFSLAHTSAAGGDWFSG